MTKVCERIVCAHFKTNFDLPLSANTIGTCNFQCGKTHQRTVGKSTRLDTFPCSVSECCPRVPSELLGQPSAVFLCGIPRCRLQSSWSCRHSVGIVQTTTSDCASPSRGIPPFPRYHHRPMHSLVTRNCPATPPTPSLSDTSLHCPDVTLTTVFRASSVAGPAALKHSSLHVVQGTCASSCCSRSSSVGASGSVALHCARPLSHEYDTRTPHCRSIRLSLARDRPSSSHAGSNVGFSRSARQFPHC